MDSSRSALSVICFALVLCFWASSALCQELTTRSEYATSFTFDTTYYGQIGSFRDSYIYEDILIMSTKNGLVVFDLANYNWLESTTNFTQSTRTMFFATGGFVPIVPFYDHVRNRIIVASESTSNPLLGILDFATLKLIPALQLVNETASNPKDAPYLNGVCGLVASDKYLYYASTSTTQSNIARHEIGNWSADPLIFTLNSTWSISRGPFARDSLTGYLYIATNDGRVVQIQTNDDDFANSPFQELQVAPSTQRLSTLEVDSLRGYLYTTTAGGSHSDPAIVYKVSLTTWAVDTSITLEANNFFVSTSAIVDNLAGGLLYLGTLSNSVIQIDLTRFVREIAYYLPDASSSGLYTAAIDLKRNVVWFGTIDPLTVSASAITISGADPCLSDCFGHGECIFRSCNCNTGQVFGYTLDWMQPWCQFLNCPDPSCNGHGNCANASCVCEPEWTNFDCTIKQCANNCTGRGTCRYENGEPIACECAIGWQGADCSVASSPLSSNEPSASGTPYVIPSTIITSAGAKISFAVALSFVITTLVI